MNIVGLAMVTRLLLKLIWLNFMALMVSPPVFGTTYQLVGVILDQSTWPKKLATKIAVIKNGSGQTAVLKTGERLPSGELITSISSKVVLAKRADGHTIEIKRDSFVADTKVNEELRRDAEANELGYDLYDRDELRNDITDGFDRMDENSKFAPPVAEFDRRLGRAPRSNRKTGYSKDQWDDGHLLEESERSFLGNEKFEEFQGWTDISPGDNFDLPPSGDELPTGQGRSMNSRKKKHQIAPFGDEF
jgi:hypothetical protein